jgi:hypothetical protein
MYLVMTPSAGSRYESEFDVCVFMDAAEIKKILEYRDADGVKVNRVFKISGLQEIQSISLTIEEHLKSAE